MTDDFKKRVSTRFGRAALSYDSASEVQLQIGQKLLAFLGKHREGGPQPKSIMELGCGTGRFTELLRHTFPDTDLLATDLSPEMVRTVQQKFADDKLFHSQVLDADRFELRAGEGAFDLICSNMASQWFSDLKGSLQTQSAHLSRGGCIMHTFLTDQTFIQWREACVLAGQEGVAVSYPAFEEIQATVPTGLQAFWQRETVTQKFQNSQAFLNYLKDIGARAAENRPMSAAGLRRACRIFEEKHVSTISYDIVFGLFFLKRDP
ncbi:malonyl-CoA O-methyltransferase [Aestuariispira insulae]|uniref:Malonyl-CoA O-methyltransferase n=2 Tax=Aestuariispira insulae TaxID=1461337 RepID=A0A3D9HN63_9PROT|nr:malonyl-CoA O-methyltransferase [Aestuariispira insulae]